MGLKSKIKSVVRPRRAVEVLAVSQDDVMAGKRVLVACGLRKRDAASEAERK